MDQLKQLNSFRLDADSNYDELQQIRERHMRSLSQVDSKLDDYHNIISAIRTEILLIIANSFFIRWPLLLNILNCFKGILWVCTAE